MQIKTIRYHFPNYKISQDTIFQTIKCVKIAQTGKWTPSYFPFLAEQLGSAHQKS